MEVGKIERNKQSMMGSEKEKMGVKKEDEEEDYGQVGCLDDEKKKKGVGSGKKISGGMRCCQAEKCSADLSDAKQYHRRHKVCEHHAKAQVVLVDGMRQRFCQQCSRLGIHLFFIYYIWFFDSFGCFAIWILSIFH